MNAHIIFGKNQETYVFNPLPIKSKCKGHAPTVKFMISRALTIVALNYH